MDIGAQTNVKVLSDRLRVVDFTIAGMTAERLALLARIRQLQKEQGSSQRDTAVTIANVSRCSAKEAAGELVLAEKLAGLPGIAKAHREGDISNAQLAAVVDIATPDSEAETIEFAKTASSAELHRHAALCRGRMFEDRQEAQRTRYLAFKTEGQQSVRLHGRLPYLEATQLEQQLRKIADRLELGSPLRSSPSARMADALLVLTNNNPSTALHEHERATRTRTSEASNSASDRPNVDLDTVESHNQSEPVTDDEPTKPTGGGESMSRFGAPLLNPLRTYVPLRVPATDSTVIDYDEEPFPETVRIDHSDMDDHDRDNDPEDEADGYESVGLFDTLDAALVAATWPPVVHKADTRIIIHWNAATGVAHFENGPPIDHLRLQALLCDAQLDVEHVDESGLPTGLITTAQHANWRQDRYLAYRDGVCRYPSCPGKGKTHAHHMFEDRADRVTCVTQMFNICNGDHTDLHDGKLRVTGDPDGVLTFTHTDGRQVRSVARPVPPKLRPRPTPFSKTERKIERKAG